MENWKRRKYLGTEEQQLYVMEDYAPKKIMNRANKASKYIIIWTRELLERERIKLKSRLNYEAKKWTFNKDKWKINITCREKLQQNPQARDQTKYDWILEIVNKGETDSRVEQNDRKFKYIKIGHFSRKYLFEHSDSFIFAFIVLSEKV